MQHDVRTPIHPRLRTLRAPSLRLCVTEVWEKPALELGLLEPGGLERALESGEARQGRARSAVLQLPGCDRRLHLRPLRHGGWLGGLLGGRLIGLRRPLEELRVNARLYAAGAPVPEPALVAGRRRRGPVWSAAVGTVYEEESVDGAAFLGGEPGAARMLRAAAAAGAAVRAFHAAGGRHPDLHVKNLLLREGRGEPRALVIDLDRVRVGTPPEPRRRMRELMRLYRSLLKRDLLERVGRRGCARFLSAYTARDRELRRALLAQLPREQRRVARHRLIYGLQAGS
jgi:tRNA A-37 threonylcarbamoyl transferase component Bud32